MQELTMAEKDRLITELPKFYTADAAPRQALKFHPKTKDACSSGNTGNISIKVAKTIVIGDTGVGKTSLINRWLSSIAVFPCFHCFPVESISSIKLCKSRSNFHLFCCLSNSLSAIILVFDFTNIKSLQHTKKWLEEALEQTSSTFPEIFLVGSKKDLCKDNELSQMENHAIELANEMNAEYWSVSSKTGENVKEFFRREAAITFEQAILGELESRGTRLTSPQIGTGGVLRIERKTREEEEKVRKSKCCSGGRGL
ncbi:PREDICTED: ras-related protein Rab-36-like [Acropora digitifera]|uniref:ras-related protein Rab-36-like n=1 Tax=Acropora digitifera TaxID=70779 RepID=UPI00077AA568|nr:PREDICTED: ras-related protein Rab-36-like [Acropora digitifera]